MTNKNNGLNENKYLLSIYKNLNLKYIFFYNYI